MKRRIISIILVISIFLSFNITSFAENIQESSLMKEITEKEDGSYILKISDSPYTYIKVYDMKNGDSVFEQYVNDKITSKYIVQQDKNIINATYFDENSSSSESIKTPEAKTTSVLTPRGTSSGRLGRIRFQYTTGTGTGICGAYVDYVKNTGSKKYDINGTYRDLAALGSFIASIFALDAAPAILIAKKVLGSLGFSLTAISFFIPKYPLQSSYEENEFKLTDIDFSAHKNSFYGTKYIISESGHHLNEVYTEGDYYPISSWNNQNFGTTIYNYLFNYSFWKIYAWN